MPLLGLGALVQVAAADLGHPLTGSATNATPQPPPIPVDANGKRLAGSWAGPYTYRNGHSGKCLDMTGYDDLAAAVQYQCLKGWASQAWYVWQAGGDGSVAYLLIGNGATGKCLDLWSFTRGSAVIQMPCYTGLANQQWIRTVANLQLYTNAATQFCMEVGGWATQDNAAIIEWDCFGNPNQLWFEYNWS